MKHIEKFSHFILNEKLHINEYMDKLSDYAYKQIKGKIGIQEVINNIAELDVYKIIFNISNNIEGKGELDLNKSFKSKNGWIFYINLNIPFFLDTIKHELDHALRLMFIPKQDILNKLNYLKAQYILDRTPQIEYFFYMIYLSSDEEINAKVKEAFGDIKELLSGKNLPSLTKEQFLMLIKTTASYQKSLDMINFKLTNCFGGFSKNNLNKLFFYYEQNKKELDEINKFSSFIRKIKLIFKGIKDAFSDKISIYDEDEKIYPNPRFDYEKFINKQGEKLQKTLFKLYDHFK